MKTFPRKVFYVIWYGPKISFYLYLFKMELNNLYGLDLPSQLKILLAYELRLKLTHIPSFDNFDFDENYVQAINSKYYDLTEFSKLYSSLSGNTFSLFHVNTRSLSKNFDQLQNVLSTVKIDFDLIGITETKQQVDKDFLVNVNITGYHMYTQPSKSNQVVLLFTLRII